MNKFSVEHRALMAMTQQESEEDFENESRLIDSDQARVYLAMNTTAWVQGAHNTLDAFNQYDKEMLGRMADYVERCSIIVCSAPFFATQNDETSRKAVFLTRDDIVPTRNDEEIEKRKRVEDSDESIMPAKARIMDLKSAAYTSNTLNKNVSERQVAPKGISARHPTGMRRAMVRKREREASISSLPGHQNLVLGIPAVATINER